MKVTNTTTQTLDFLVKDGKQKNGAAETCSVAAGATEDLNIDINSPQVKGYILAGAIVVSDSIAAKVEAAVAAPDKK